MGADESLEICILTTSTDTLVRLAVLAETVVLCERLGHESWKTQKKRKIALVGIHHTCWLVIGHDYSRKVRLMWMSRVVLLVCFDCCFCVKGRQKRKKCLRACYLYGLPLIDGERERDDDDDDDDYCMMMTILDVTAPKVHLPHFLTCNAKIHDGFQLLNCSPPEWNIPPA